MLARGSQTARECRDASLYLGLSQLGSRLPEAVRELRDRVGEISRIAATVRMTLRLRPPSRLALCEVLRF